MTTRQREIRRRQLDDQLLVLNNVLPEARPRGGWVKSIRESLGMTLDTFGKRIGGSRQLAAQLEKSESEDTITIKRLRIAAEALNCHLSVVLVPKQPLEQMMEEAALKTARNLVGQVENTMQLEDQAVGSKQVYEMTRQTAIDLIRENDSRIWE